MSVSVVTDKEVKWLQIQLDAVLSEINKSYFSKLWTKFGREWSPGPYNGTVFLLDVLQIDEVDGRVTDLFQHIDSTEHSVLYSFSKVCWLLYYIYTGCNRRNGPDFGRVFLMLNYTEKPQNTYIQS